MGVRIEFILSAKLLAIFFRSRNLNENNSPKTVQFGINYTVSHDHIVFMTNNLPFLARSPLKISEKALIEQFKV